MQEGSRASQVLLFPNKIKVVSNKFLSVKNHDHNHNETVRTLKIFNIAVFKFNNLLTVGWSEKIKLVLEIRNSAKNLSFGRKRRFVKSERFLLMFRSAPRQLK